MSVMTLREHNRNMFEWDAVITTGPYTACAKTTFIHKSFRFIDLDKPFQVPAAPTFYSPDDDISAGRLSRFSNVEDMISSLKAPR